MELDISYSASIAAIEGVAVKAVVDLTGLPFDAIIAYRIETKADPIVEMKDSPWSRSGKVTFALARNPRYQLSVHVNIRKIFDHMEDETWIGQYVAFIVKDSNWRYAFHVDWKTGKPIRILTHGEFPYRQFCDDVLDVLGSISE